MFSLFLVTHKSDFKNHIHNFNHQNSMMLKQEMNKIPTQGHFTYAPICLICLSSSREKKWSHILMKINYQQQQQQQQQQC
ncbi:hypothetical protein DERF_010328 [Dermatophagoides farinae]|uniref:Uncharacterized protein n=1 Tax=Dermatophagoides farinae TaxID=6954 RepID=A0A922HWT4_DERFA|nr:hypothetical protein DERF_010328 [Dermatophagoides farinae]